MLNLGDYHNFYLMTDVLLLADVFENFRDVCLQNYGLDPLHYITLPSLAWDACLKITNVKLELIKDPDMYIMFEKGIRGGYSGIGRRFFKANNLLCEDYDANNPTTFIIYVDCNNLYGKAMVMKLPTHGLTWMTEEEIRIIDWINIDPDSDCGFIVEVDLEYPADLHDLHADYPLAPEPMVVTEDMLSPYCQQFKGSVCLNHQSKKLIQNLSHKKNYVIHSNQLQLYLQLGMKLTKVHRGIRFCQSAWMKPYIDLNTDLRKKADNEFEKSLFKLMNNSVYGKTMENKRRHRDIKLVTDEATAKKTIANPRFQQFTIFNEDLVGIAMAKRITILDKPIYVGFSILEFAKHVMYSFHYKHMLPRYGKRVKMLLTDTDSFIYGIETDDLYQDLREDADHYDFSDYPQDHPNFSTANKKVLGKMKDEMMGRPISAFVGLKSKMYSFICDGRESKRAKGIKRTTVENEISFAQYLDCLMEQQFFNHDMNLIRSKLHHVYAVNVTKTSLTPYDDKRYIFDDGIDSLPYGHSAIEVVETTDMDYSE